MNNRLETIERLDRLLSQLTYIEVKLVVRQIANAHVLRTMENTINARSRSSIRTHNSQK